MLAFLLSVWDVVFSVTLLCFANAILSTLTVISCYQYNLFTLTVILS